MEDTFSSLQMRSWHPGTLTHTVRVPSSHHLLPPSSTSTSSTSSRDKTNHKHLPCGYFSLLTTFLWEDAEESLCCCLSSPFHHSCFSLTSSQFNIELSQAKDIRWRPLESAASCLGKYGDGWSSLGRKLSILTSLPPPLYPHVHLLSSSSNVPPSSNCYSGELRAVRRRRRFCFQYLYWEERLGGLAGGTWWLTQGHRQHFLPAGTMEGSEAR